MKKPSSWSPKKRWRCGPHRQKARRWDPPRRHHLSWPPQPRKETRHVYSSKKIHSISLSIINHSQVPRISSSSSSTSSSYVYIYIYIYIYIHIYILHIYIYIHTYIHTYLYIYIHTYIHTYLYIYIYYISHVSILWGRCKNRWEHGPNMAKPLVGTIGHLRGLQVLRRLLKLQLCHGVLAMLVAGRTWGLEVMDVGISMANDVWWWMVNDTLWLMMVYV